MRVPALAYEEETGQLRAIVSGAEWAEFPRLYEAPGCAGPWQDLGWAFSFSGGPSPPVSKTVGALRLGGPGEQDAILIVPHYAMEHMQIAFGDASLPESFSLDPTMYAMVSPERRVSAAVVGGDFVTLSLGLARDLVISTDLYADDCGSGSCVMFGATNEPTTFDRDGFPPRGTGIRWPFAALAMEPSPESGSPWRGLLFYEGCVLGDCRLGATWLRIAPP